MFKNVLAAYDGSEVSARAFRVAVDLAHAFGGRVRVVLVIALPPIDALPVASEDERARAADALAELVRSSPKEVPVESEIAFGVPAAVLLERAGHGVDHVVLGRTGKGAVHRFLLGSVSRELVSRATTSITLVA